MGSLNQFIFRGNKDKYLKRDEIVTCDECGSVCLKGDEYRVGWEVMCKTCFNDQYQLRKGK